MNISAYQIERWRQSGALPRPRRHGLGRGKGTRAEALDQATIDVAVRLASAAHQGHRVPRLHLIERFAAGQIMDESRVRAAFHAQLDIVARMTAADVPDDDAGWDARQTIAQRAARHPSAGDSVSYHDLVQAVEGAPEPAELAPKIRKAAVSAAVHALGGGSEAVGEDFVALVAVSARLSSQEHEALLRTRQLAELAGEHAWEQAAETMSVANLRAVLDSTDVSRLRRAAEAQQMIQVIQTLMTFLGILDIAGQGAAVPETLADRFNGTALQSIRADPLWRQAGGAPLILRTRHRVMFQVLSTLVSLAIPGQLELLEGYTARLRVLVGCDLPHPHVRPPQ